MESNVISKRATIRWRRDVPKETLQGLTEGYSLDKILDESGFFFKALPDAKPFFLSRKHIFENRKDILFIEKKATYRLESMDGKFSNIKIFRELENIKCRLQPLAAGIIRNFKLKHQKSLAKYLLSWINDNASFADILKM